MPALTPYTKIRKRLTCSEFDASGAATVYLDGSQPIGVLLRTPGGIWAMVLDQGWERSRNLTGAMRSCAVGYVNLTGQSRP
jgi:hypothetical protein